jgi:predicted lysophospholipase L1 biosynthesis ABC-type transport system permease subunit
VAVVSEELARREWPGESAIGKRIRRGRPQETGFQWLTVVGVIRNIKEDSFNFRVDQPAMYLPYAQEGRLQLNMPVVLVVRASGDPGALTAAIRRTVRAVDPDQPVSAAGRLTENLNEVLAADRFGAVLAGTLAPLGLLLAALGLYAVMAFSVLQRRAEIGLRMALGARPRDVRALVFGQGGRLIAAGLAAGMTGAWLLTRLLSGFLFQVSPTDSASFLGAGSLLTAVALLACGIPARRATRVDPIRALRAE